jgi:tRNA(Ile)-lysidine synthase
MLARLRDELGREFPSSARVVLAVSGGADSVALLRGWLEARPSFCDELLVATFDHGLRKESADEARFVQELSSELGVPCVVGSPDRPIDARPDHSVESAARRARYAFLSQVALQQQRTSVVTAHTADDQMETVLFRVVRGTGLAGLAGIPSRREIAPGVDVVRPMLGIRRREIEDYLASLSQTFIVDPSNSELRFARNQLRQVVLPMLREQVHAGVDDALLRLAETARAEWASRETEVQAALAECLVSSSDEEVVLDTVPFGSFDERLAGRVLREVVRRLRGPLRDVGWRSVLQALAVARPEGPVRIDWPGKVSISRMPAGHLRIVAGRTSTP